MVLGVDGERHGRLVAGLLRHSENRRLGGGDGLLVAWTVTVVLPSSPAFLSMSICAPVSSLMH